MSATNRRAPTEPVPGDLSSAASAVFRDRLPLAIEYAGLLATEGVVRGLIGPRETPRLWDRHLLNCAALTETIPLGAAVADVGSGAGLPGVVLAIARPDLRITLIESLARRTIFLTEVVDALGLADATTVWRGRAEEAGPLAGTFDIATARAVAPLDRLAGWCLPLVVPGGRLLAIKGESAAVELETHTAALRRLGAASFAVRRYGEELLAPPTTVIEVTRARRR